MGEALRAAQAATLATVLVGLVGLGQQQPQQQQQQLPQQLRQILEDPHRRAPLAATLASKCPFNLMYPICMALWQRATFLRWFRLHVASLHLPMAQPTLLLRRANADGLGVKCSRSK